MTQSNNYYLEMELTAPGKVILFGEHSVVYGKKAVAATLGLYTRLHLKENNSGSISLQFPNIELEETFPLMVVQESFNIGDDTKEIKSLTEVFRLFYEKHGRNTLTDGQRASLITFFHSFGCYMTSCSGFTLRIETDLPVSSGAGSSASFSVILTAAALLLNLAKSNKLSEYIIRDGNGIDIKGELRELISEKAYSCEKIFHGTPSGIDHSVILHGSALEFIKGVNVNMLKPINGGPIRVLLVNTKVPRSTKKQVEIFRRWKDKFPDVMQNILDAMGDIATDGVETLLNMKRNPSELEKHESRLADLIALNHGLLRTVELSHDSLEKVCTFAKKHGLSAKLTGAGGGGFSFIYISSQTPPETIFCLKEELKQAGFEANEVILGGPGLKIKSLSL